MTPNDKDQKRKEANRIRQYNFRKKKKTSEQAGIRKKKDSIRSAERRKGKLSSNFTMLITFLYLITFRT
jgi:hypothetical protein